MCWGQAGSALVSVAACPLRRARSGLGNLGQLLVQCGSAGIGVADDGAEQATHGARKVVANCRSRIESPDIDQPNSTGDPVG
jgi:hypothetical protein